MSRIKPDSYLPIAQKPERTLLQFYLDAITSMAVTKVISEQEAAVLFDKVGAWEQAARESPL